MTSLSNDLKHAIIDAYFQIAKFYRFNFNNLVYSITISENLASNVSEELWNHQKEAH